MAGASWAIESETVRKQFEEWAKWERENHQAAFPNYRFQPQTQEAKARKRKERFDDDSLEDSDLDDPIYMGRGTTPGSARSLRAKKLRRTAREPSYTPSFGSEGDWGSPDPYAGAMYNASYYPSANPGKPLPAAHPGVGQSTGYLHMTSHPNARFANIGHVEDVHYYPSEAPGNPYGSQVPTGLPGASHDDLIGETNLDNGHLTFTGTSVDPDLVAFDHDLAAGSNEGFRADDFLGAEQANFIHQEGNTDDFGSWDHFGDDH